MEPFFGLMLLFGVSPCSRVHGQCRERTFSKRLESVRKGRRLCKHQQSGCAIEALQIVGWTASEPGEDRREDGSLADGWNTSRSICPRGELTRRYR